MFKVPVAYHSILVACGSVLAGQGLIIAKHNYGNGIEDGSYRGWRMQKEGGY